MPLLTASWLRRPLANAAEPPPEPVTVPSSVIVTGVAQEHGAR